MFSQDCTILSIQKSYRAIITPDNNSLSVTAETGTSNVALMLYRSSNEITAISVPDSGIAVIVTPCKNSAAILIESRAQVYLLGRLIQFLLNTASQLLLIYRAVP